MDKMDKMDKMVLPWMFFLLCTEEGRLAQVYDLDQSFLSMAGKGHPSTTQYASDHAAEKP
jgi:hypothetical protein